MAFAIDLNPRQSARTLEQAIRHQAEVILESRLWPQGEPLACRLERATQPDVKGGHGAALLVLACGPATDGTDPNSPAVAQEWLRIAEQYAQLAGTYCDLIIRLGEQYYLCSADVVRVEKPSQGNQEIRFYLSRPQNLQVAQRRIYRRIQLISSAKVRLRWTREGEGNNEAVGWLCNLSLGGMACRADAAVADRLYIGETLSAEFRLSPTDLDPLYFDAILCNKTPAGTEGKTVVGLQFLTGPEYQASTRSVDILRRGMTDRHIVAGHSCEESL